MASCFEFTLHSRQRIVERELADNDLAAAMAGRATEYDGRTYHYDNHSRVCVVTSGDKVVTCYRMHKKQVKKFLSK